ncbi:uncharacterized protein B0I36DRAFT_153664 [Microdochium trichocladiopsis]|uniref:Uncharacterized protein n=1 Tax=Microdochium trichocladiopsis TaxID=1682393 RepID=A0A9P8XZN5_9PEZI|nr:uncharacterized protein B0I36DRAFT_153664 [Microdochium trichocladiopsis]KAH7026087.1 hypothetical protein B0I36DRAFT_153664 [Microdochium trichocladiopsis]
MMAGGGSDHRDHERSATPAPGDMAAGDALRAIEASANGNATSPMKCCCGLEECVFLKHNYSVLDSVERDVHTAARMGQALLARHEAYMADAERDRNELTARIGQLEMDNKELQERNARTVEENRSLLDQLEALNTSVNDSESRIKSLEAGLLSSQQMIRRLERETERAMLLERQISFLEQEQEDLQSSLSLSREEARSAVSRWKKAERGIVDLQEQLERMEREMREEREHHEQMMGRIEKQRDMEKELNAAAGRLKGAAALKSLNQTGSGSAVVSHFVRDLLQDNANLQHGMAQLREMLINSNDEIQALRDQLMFHQPVESQDGTTTPTLRAELGGSELSPTKENPPRLSQELHIHHHYHVTPKQENKKARKKRPGLTGGVFIPPALHHSGTPPMLHGRSSSGDRSVEGHRLPRWSMLSEQSSDFALSSGLSSPTSVDNRNSVFDPRLDSFPGSPTTSVDPMSPSWRASHRKQPSNMSARSFQLSAPFSPAQPMPMSTHTIVEECDDGDVPPELLNHTDESAADDETSSRDHDGTNEDISVVLEDMDDDYTSQRRLRRVLSHESIISLSGGLDIHTLKARPSQLTLRHLGSSAASVTTSSTVTARPILSRDSAKRSSTMLRDHYGLTPVGSLRSVSSGSTQNGHSKLGAWTGWRPWGGSSTTTNSSTTTTTVSTTTTTTSLPTSITSATVATAAFPVDVAGFTTPNPSTPAPKKTHSEKSSAAASMKYFGRSPGINQPGAIPGFHEFLAAAQKRVPPSRVQPVSVDHTALREVLEEA